MLDHWLTGSGREILVLSFATTQIISIIFDALRVVLFSRLDIQDKVSILFTIVFLDPWMLVFRMFKAVVVKLIGLNAARKLKYAVLRLFPKTRKKR